MSDKVRVLRILEYVGDREWVENTLRRTGVPLNGTWTIPGLNPNGRCIKSAIIDQFPEILGTIAEVKTEIESEEESKNEKL